MQLLANALTCLAVLAVLSTPAEAGVRAPAFTFTSTFTLVLDDATNATLTLDTGQVTARATAGPLSISGVPDGLHTWRLTYTDTTGEVAEVVGEFTAQDLTPLIAAQVQRAVTASQGAQQEAQAARATAEANLNATHAARGILEATLEAIEAVHPEDLPRRADLEALAQAQAAQLSAIVTLFHEAAENQTRALEEAHHELQTFRNAASFVVGLVLLGLGLLTVYLSRLRHQLKRLTVPSQRSTPRTRTDAPAPRTRPARAHGRTEELDRGGTRE
jgi:hypothetical protein